MHLWVHFSISEVGKAWMVSLFLSGGDTKLHTMVIRVALNFFRKELKNDTKGLV